MPLIPINTTNFCRIGATNLVSESIAHLTRNAHGYEIGALWARNSIDLEAEFTLECQVNYDEGVRKQYGMAFVLHNMGCEFIPTATGCELSLGFRELDNSVAVVIQTCPNHEFFIADNSPVNNALSRISDLHPSIPDNIAANQWLDFSIKLEGTLLTAELDGRNTKYDLGVGFSNVFDNDVDISDITWGFTATTGGFGASLSTIKVKDINF